MNDIAAGAADVYSSFVSFDVVASLEGGGGVVLCAEGATCVAGGVEADVEGGELVC